MPAAPEPPVCGITPTRVRTPAGSRAGSRPSTDTSPPSRRRSPAQISTVVVLPAPLGPSTAVTAPAAAVNDSPADRLGVAVPLDEVADGNGGRHVIEHRFVGITRS